MAQEITISGGLSVNKLGKKAALSGSEKKDMAGDHYVQTVEDIGTTDEQIDNADIVTLGYVAFKNVGSGIIKVGPAAGTYTLILDPGEFVGPVKWASSTIHAICDITNGQLEMLLIEA